ncbi:hypothetical protein [Flavobacterium acetivorans]|uniref:hypothetical protein n=1 Tax=Flavobacterium acetivorans TaxID=2893883 RepID=UPI001E5380AB|nr:hypothetical protein [Flavobacterium sp. F-29]UFH35747.1 hypothetical protein LNP19_01580 [Flavobacterium sp. F-29]
MSTKKIIQIIAVTFLIIAVILLVPNTNWQKSSSVLGFISLVCGTLGSIISIFVPTTYTYNFKEDNWANDSNGFTLYIKAKKHGLGNSPQVQTFLKDGLMYQEVGVSSNHDEKGNVTIGANSLFSGKVVIS